jgi:hypothetical protein
MTARRQIQYRQAAMTKRKSRIWIKPMALIVGSAMAQRVCHASQRMFTIRSTTRTKINKPSDTAHDKDSSVNSLKQK